MWCKLNWIAVLHFGMYGYRFALSEKNVTHSLSVKRRAPPTGNYGRPKKLRLPTESA